MDRRVEIDDDEFNALSRNVGGSSQIKSKKPSYSSTNCHKSDRLEGMNEEEIDDLLRDVEWIEDPVESENYDKKIKPKSEERVNAVPEPKPEHLEILRKQFGHAKFRPMQWEIIYNILESKRDGCVIMATGYGKSLCYQFPPVFCNGTALVITPLISLMEDQTLALEAANIPACYLGAGQAGQGNKMDKLVKGDYRVVYLTPEFCTGDSGKNLFDRLVSSKKITLVAIDEAHCVSQWGHDFRHSYRRLGKIRDIFGFSTPILALTATATKQVQDDICSSLKLRNPFRFCSGFDRPNLYLAVHSKGLSIISDLRRLMDNGREIRFGGPTIVYCPTKKATENVAKALEEFGITCRYYHADLNAKLRKEVHHMFVRDEIQVIVATVAFGMGIDKPDVRLIIHYGAPKDMESYYQEVGRAGRDGLQSQCHCYYSTSDFATNQYFLKDLSGQAYEHRRSGMLKMEQYLQSRQCRRQFLLSHFEPEKTNTVKKPLDNCCDNCTFRRTHGDTQPEIFGVNEDGTYDFSEDAKLLLSAADFFKGRFGITMIIKFLVGGKCNRFRSNEEESEIYGKGKHKPTEWWKGLGRILVQEGFLEEVALRNCVPGRFPMNTIKVGKRGVDFLHTKNTPLNFFITEDMLNILKRGKNRSALSVSSNWNEPVILPLFPASSQTANGITSEQPRMSKEEEEKQGKLYCELLKLRNNLAKQHSYMPYMVANNKTLLDVAALRPETTSDLASVDGIGAAKIEKFGAAILDVVREFCQKHGLKMKGTNKLEPETSSVTQNKKDVSVKLPTNSSLTSSQKVTYSLFQTLGMTVDAIATERMIGARSIYDHLAAAIKAGLPLDVGRLGVTEDIQETVVKAIRSPPVYSDISRLRPIKDNCPNFISYEDIKITIAILTHKYGLDNNKINVTDLHTFKHIPVQKASVTSLQSTTAATQVSNSLNQRPTEKNAETQRFDLSSFKQDNFKETNGPSKSECSLSQKKSENSIKGPNISNVNKSELWKDNDIFESMTTASESNVHQKTEKKVSLSEYRQNTFKNAQTPKCSSPSAHSRSESSSSRKEKEERSEQLFDFVDISKNNIVVPDNNAPKYDKTDMKRKPKDYLEQMKKKMKTNSLFRK